MSKNDPKLIVEGGGGWNEDVLDGKQSGLGGRGRDDYSGLESIR